MALPLPPLKIPKGKAARPGPAKPAPKSKAETIAEKVGRAVGKKIKAAVTRKAKELVGRILPGTTKRGREKAERDDEVEGRLSKDDIATAAGMMGHAGKGTPHKITAADSQARSRRLAKARKVWESMPPSRRRHRNH